MVKSIVLAFVLMAILTTIPPTAPCARNKKVKVGDTVTLDGVFSVIDGENIQERPMKYEAIKLVEAISIVYDDGEDGAVQAMKLWFDRKQKGLFEKWLGKKVRVTGIVDYYWFGPSTMPNPAKFQVIEVKPR